MHTHIYVHIYIYVSVCKYIDMYTYHIVYFHGRPCQLSLSLFLARAFSLSVSAYSLTTHVVGTLLKENRVIRRIHSPEFVIIRRCHLYTHAHTKAYVCFLERLQCFSECLHTYMKPLTYTHIKPRDKPDALRGHCNILQRTATHCNMLQHT